jgi:hypothetical protein
MKQSKTSQPDSSFSFIRSLLLFLLIIFISSTPVVIEQMNKPERRLPKLFARSGRWQVIHTSKRQSQWEASDGSVAEYVSYRPTDNGVEVVLAPTELTTREAYFNGEAVITGAFRLSTEVHTPTGCHNGLVFRGNAEGEYYLFLVSETSYTVEILQRTDNADLPREAIILNTPFPELVTEPHRLTVLSDGHSYFFYINDIYVNSMSDSRLNGNRTGIEVFT